MEQNVSQEVLELIADGCTVSERMNWSCTNHFFNANIANSEKAFISSMSQAIAPGYLLILLSNSSSLAGGRVISKQEELSKTVYDYIKNSKFSSSDLRKLNTQFKKIKNKETLLKGFLSGSSSIEQHNSLKAVAQVFVAENQCLAEFLAKFFIFLGKNVNAKNAFGNTVLAHGIATKNKPLIDFLCMHGADSGYLTDDEKDLFNNITSETKVFIRG